MSVSCGSSATATLYSNRVSIATVTEASGETSAGSVVATPVVQTTTITQAIATATLYETVCETVVVASQAGRRTTVAASQATTSTDVRPTGTTTMVTSSTQAGQVVLVTSYSTMSATSVYVVLKTQSPSPSINSDVGQSNGPTSSPAPSPHVGPIAGGIAAAVVVLALFGCLFWFCRKRSRRERDTRALDVFFKDAPNSGDDQGEMIESPSAMRRRSSRILDLEKVSSEGNGEATWAALTERSGQVDDGDGTVVTEAPRLGYQSRNSIHTAFSLPSEGAEVGMNAGEGGGGWDAGVRTDGRMVEEPQALLIRTGSDMSTSSIPVLPYSVPISPMGLYEGGPPPRLRHLSTHSAELSSAFHSLPPSPMYWPTPLPNGVEGAPWTASAPNTLGRQAVPRVNHHHVSVSGVYPSMLPAMPPPSVYGQQMPERPKSALELVAAPNRSSSPHQWSPPTSPTIQSSRKNSRSSVHGYSQYGSLTHWSPPLAPLRATSSSHRPTRPTVRPQLSGEYPPSRYSHLDIVPQSQAAEDQSSTTTEARPRSRSVSGGALLQSAAPPAVGVQASDSATSSTSSSQNNSLSIRNVSPEQEAGGEGGNRPAPLS